MERTRRCCSPGATEKVLSRIHSVPVSCLRLPPTSGQLDGALMPERGPLGSSARELLPPARVASQLAAAVTAVMSEWEDYDFKRKNEQEEQLPAFSQHG